MKKQEIEDKKNSLYSLILDREAKLRRADYISAKIADGRAKQGEYDDVIAMKSVWAEEINSAKGQIEELEKEVPDNEKSPETL